MTMMNVQSVRTFALATGLIGLSACAETSGTGGEQVFYDVAVEVHPEVADGAFETATGWQVDLEEAVVAVGPIYLWEAPPLAGASAVDDDDSLSWSQWVLDGLMPTAWAHPGDSHFSGGEIRGELLGQWAVPLLGEDRLSLGRARGVAGRVRSFTVVLDPAGPTTEGSMASLLDGHQAFVRGVARQGSMEVPFRGTLDIPDEGLQRQVDGIGTDLELEEGGDLTVVIDPRPWFDQAHFDRLLDEAEQHESGEYLIDAKSQVRSAWFLGIRSPRGYEATWSEPNAAGQDGS